MLNRFILIAFLLLIVGMGASLASSRYRIHIGILAVEEMGGGVSVEETFIGGPTRVSLKLEGIDSKATDSVITSRSDALSGLRSVRRLNVAKSPIGDAGLAVLMQHWGATVEYVNIAETNITTHGIADLASCPKLTKIILSSSQYGEAVGRVFSNIPRIQVVVE